MYIKLPMQHNTKSLISLRKNETQSYKVRHRPSCILTQPPAYLRRVCRLISVFAFRLLHWACKAAKKALIRLCGRVNGFRLGYCEAIQKKGSEKRSHELTSSILSSRYKLELRLRGHGRNKPVCIATCTQSHGLSRTILEARKMTPTSTCSA